MAIETPTWIYKSKGDKQTASEMNQLAQSVIMNATELSNIKDDVVELSNKTYNPEAYSGMGRVILRKNIVGIVNVLTQSMINQDNTIYEIRYDFDLNGEEVTIPEGCVLDFQGGSLNNGTIIFKNTNIYNIGNLTIFRHILIFGSIDNKHLSVKWFGLKSDNEDYSTDNWSILVNYVIPAAENTGKEIYVPNGYFYFNDTIRIINVELNCDGTLIYNGRIQNKALVIGNESNVVTQQTYTIKLNQQADIRQHYELSGSKYIIPENYGVEFINLWHCQINIESVEGFAKEVTLIGDGKGFASNRIDIKRIGRYPYYCIKLTNKNNGYINENLFIGGALKTYESPLNKVQNYAIILDETSGNSYLVINNNVFLKQCSEHFYSAVKINYGWDNLFFGMRAEDCTHPMIVENRDSLNNVFVGNSLSETIHTSSTIVAGYGDLFSLKTIRTDKVCYFNYKNGSNFYYGSNLLYYNGDSSYNNVSTGLRGYKVKVYDKQTLKLESNIGTTMSIVCFDENNQKIQITQENYEEYVINMKNTYLSNGELKSTTGTLYDIEATFTGKVHSVFIGVQAIGSRITLLSSLQAELLNVDKMNKAYIVPQEAQGFDIGDSLWIETLNKYIFYTGTEWVDATGVTV